MASEEDCACRCSFVLLNAFAWPLQPSEVVTHLALTLEQNQAIGAFYLCWNKDGFTCQAQNQRQNPSQRKRVRGLMNILNLLKRCLKSCISLEGSLSLLLPPGLDLPSQVGSEILQGMYTARNAEKGVDLA